MKKFERNHGVVVRVMVDHVKGNIMGDLI